MAFLSSGLIGGGGGGRRRGNTLIGRYGGSGGRGGVFSTFRRRQVQRAHGRGEFLHWVR